MISVRIATEDDAIWAMLEPVSRTGETYALDRAVSREAALAAFIKNEVYASHVIPAHAGIQCYIASR
ncbi:hypothetical protein [Novosphingobium sp.]|uniref:hypothetical protein n=1 Tax=Novosphingobium sp. TaxID=1874826 RepID=UPI003D0DDE7B